MKTLVGSFLMCCMLLPSGTHAQRKGNLKDRDFPEQRRTPQGIIDRAGGTHNKSNIGAFFENRGKLYARRLSQGVSGEFPTGSLHEYIYRINPFVGIPGNVIQGRYTTDEEWEAVAGYNNRDSAKIAFSDKPNTWPSTGWPVKDASGKPVFVSNQDSYCVYSDTNNSRRMLGLQINQTGYAFSAKSIRDMIVWIFDVTNHSQRTYDSLYFEMYIDIDVGGYTTEYGDDRLVFDKKWNRVYAYDVDGWSDEWNAPTGVFGVLIMQTPKVNGVELGITDFHYNTYDDDIDVDSVQYGIMSSAQSLYQSSVGPRFFHPGANAPDFHFDDLSTQPAGGLDPIGNASSGPYRLAPGDTLRFITAFVAGNTVAELDSTTVHAYNLLANNFVFTAPPPPPRVSVIAGDRKVIVTWDNGSESSRDLSTGKLNFEGYRVYKSIDKGQHWDQIDRNLMPGMGADPVPIASFDRVDGEGKNTGLQYLYVDSSVTNGFEYWYSVTAYSTSDEFGAYLESARGYSTEDANLGIGVPRSSATGRLPVHSTTPIQTGTGSANVVIQIDPMDVAQAGSKAYAVSFAPAATICQGTFKSIVEVHVDSNGAKTTDAFSLSFTSPTQYVVRNLTEGTVLIPTGSYRSGTPILIEGLSLTMTDTSSATADQPTTGDSIVLSPGIQVAVGGAAVLPLQPFAYGTHYSTTTGLVLTIVQGDTLPRSRITYKDIFSFETSAWGVTQGATAADLDKVKVVPNPYLVSSLYEEEFGLLRREPIRQLKFNNLPSRCTIYIFTIAGDKVQTIEHNSDNGTETWTMKAAGGREIAPGIYLYLVKTDTAEKLGRFAVIK